MSRTLPNTLAVVLLSMFPALPAHAGVDYNDWNYALDSTNDGSGGSTYEYLGLAVSQHNNQLMFAVSTNMPITGNTAGNSSALNHSISHGDLWLNFSDHNLDIPDEFNDANVFAIRFSAANDSLGNTPLTPNSTLGLYGNVTSAALATSNRGYSSLQQYINHGFGRSADAMGDLESTSANVVPYLGNGAMQTVMHSGTWLADVTLMSQADLLAAGVDFAHFGNAYAGSQTFGFSVDASSLPVGSYTAHMFMECINDGIAIANQVSATSIPEPASLAIIATGLLLMAPLRRRLA